MIYLDNNATTPLLPEVRAAMTQAMSSLYGNPSSAHTLGRTARAALSHARDSVAHLLGSVDSSCLVFTSGGTESNNIVILSAALTAHCPRIITTAVEHSSVLRLCEDLAERQVADVVTLPVCPDGRVDLDRLSHSLTPATALVSVQYVNNETGVVQDIEEIGRICSKAGVPFHTDAAQAYGKLAFDVRNMPIDFLTCSAHKINGPKGVGALYLKDKRRLRPLMHGGPQESGLRPGTENVIGIVGFGAAAELRRHCLSEAIERMRDCRDAFEDLLSDRIPGTRFNGSSTTRVCNTSNVKFPRVEGAAMVAQLDAAGIFCSQNSACHNQRPEPSHVLSAMGMSEDEAFACVRFCFSQENTRDDVARATEAIAMSYAHLVGEEHGAQIPMSTATKNTVDRPAFRHESRGRDEI